MLEVILDTLEAAVSTVFEIGQKETLSNKQFQKKI